MPRKAVTAKVSEPAVFNLDDFRAVKHFVWREITREDHDPLRVKLLELNVRESDAIPMKTTTPLKDSMEAVAGYIVEWDFQAENQQTGEVIDVPPPAEAGWQVMELLDRQTASDIIGWLKYPHAMRREAEKNASSSSETTDEPSSGEKKTTA